MLRKTLWAMMTAAGLAVPMAMTSHASAADFRVEFGTRPAHHHRTFEVFYRDCSRNPWRCYGHFDSHFQAERVVHRLEHQGFSAYVAHR